MEYVAIGIVSAMVFTATLLGALLLYCWTTAIMERKLIERKQSEAIMPSIKEEKSMKDRIEGLEAIGAKARKITTEIAGNYVIAVSTEPAKKKKYLCVYESSKKLDFKRGAKHERVLVKAFPYSNEEGYVNAYKSALKYLAVLEDKIAL